MIYIVMEKDSGTGYYEVLASFKSVVEASRLVSERNLVNGNKSCTIEKIEDN